MGQHRLILGGRYRSARQDAIGHNGWNQKSRLHGGAHARLGTYCLGTLPNTGSDASPAAPLRWPHPEPVEGGNV